MRVDAFDFHLPEDRIALRPAEPRDTARMLVVRPGAAPELEDRIVRDLPDFLRPGDAVVVNDTRVIPAALEGVRSREGGSDVAVEATLIKRLTPDRWRAFAKPGKRLRVGDRIRFGGEGGACLLGTLDGAVAAKEEDGSIVLAFDLAGDVLDEAVAAVGHMPIPPYIAARRHEDARDKDDYQTLFARVAGSVAAPTASLHFTPDLLARMAATGATLHKVTLHVGPGTFLPVKAEDTSGHTMHAEWGEVTRETADALNAVKAKGGRIFTIGSTSTRLIESAAGEDGLIRPFVGETDIFITPGYRFRAVDGMLTNFHLPRSTLVMLVAAFIGHEPQKRAYAHAIAENYRFYSYGDACLLLPQGGA
ncbi:S-adenosylmethionine:tRNA ribosyltransferase-isomerase [Xanthobacter flavus]|uniref:S-adenosylmethionine:tRNA ribosyltransferase-isomerase n=1 Tax=Xanthobacter flavus TaxID=281 RepID=A0A9W6CK97_XANFL|nr:tRNA preQ1(34) S-adenosylmethionine ribosyltransferase-isomerase QueA [Xanthobacter flavus]MDR6332311.1 S-adenosylmethionine:tRNA ribosyltransferase-isomerase [Xanthobacter flavus]GLI21940.1 S-adenosylmethionine:tRNA ribosyltransferase-isomerase [Xanthobacter flavus]